MQELMSFCLHTVSYTDIGSVKTKSRDKVKQPTCDQWLTEIPGPKEDGEGFAQHVPVVFPITCTIIEFEKNRDCQ